MCKKGSLTKILVLLCVVALLFSAGCSKEAATTTPEKKETKIITLRVGAGHDPKAVPWTGALEGFFVPEVNKRLAERGNNYQIEWIKGYAGTVAKLGEELEAVEANMLDVGYVNFVFEPSKLEMYNICYSVPFSTGSAEIQNKVFGKLFREYDWMMKDIERYNQKLLGISSTENYNMYTTFEFKTTADLKGKRIGGAGANLAWLSGTGAVGVQSNVPDTYTGLQTNLLDASIMPTASVIKAKVYEVADYLLQVDFGAILVGGVTVNMDVWNKLPKEVQDVMIEVGEDFETYQGKFADQTYKEQLEVAKGWKTITLTQTEKEAWAKMLPNLPAEFVKKMEGLGYKDAGKFMKAYLEGLKAEGIKLPREWM